jgi:hypothetical protein
MRRRQWTEIGNCEHTEIDFGEATFADDLAEFEVV